MLEPEPKHLKGYSSECLRVPENEPNVKNDDYRWAPETKPKPRVMRTWDKAQVVKILVLETKTKPEYRKSDHNERVSGKLKRN